MTKQTARVLIAAVGFFFVAIGAVFPQTESGTENGPEDAEARKKYFYEWTDNQGIVHISDNFGAVPERYRSEARQRESRKSNLPPGGQQATGAPEFSTGQYNSDADAAAAAKAEWQQRIREWKERLVSAEKRYRDVERERNELFRTWGSPALAPIGSKLKAEQLDEQMRQVRAEIDKAENMIESVIPEEARKAGIPPGWLRE